MNNSILTYYAQQGTAFLHPGGQVATTWLLQQLSDTTAAMVLDIGCGTGATLVELSRLKNVKVYGVDIHEPMLTTARQRLHFCKVQAEVKLVQADGFLPFPPSSFSHITAESVFGIVREEILQTLLQECLRILKPGGELVVNDAIWRSDADIHDIHSINTRCLKDFGIIQSQAMFAGKESWSDFFVKSGFEVVNVWYVPQELPSPAKKYLLDKRSIYFSRIKKIRAWLSPWFIWHAMYFNWKMFFRHRNSRHILQSCLFVLRKPTSSE